MPSCNTGSGISIPTISTAAVVALLLIAGCASLDADRELDITARSGPSHHQ